MNALYEKQVVFFGGKGGVGKSTSSSAFSSGAAQRGKRTLLVSTDPAHNIGDIFHIKMGGKIKKLAENLWGLEINPEMESKKYIKTVKHNLKGLIKPRMMDEVHRQIDLASSSPGADEAALFDRLVTIILEEVGNYDIIVFDTAPTGHTIRLLSLPEMMGAWIEGMLNRRKTIMENYSQLLGDGEPLEDDPIYEILNRRKLRFAAVREIMLDSRKTSYVFVLNPERLPILETEKAIEKFSKFNLNVEYLVINKVLPETIDGTFFQKRRDHQTKYLGTIDTTFKKQKKIFLPLLEDDISSLADVEKMSNYLLRSNNY